MIDNNVINKVNKDNQIEIIGSDHLLMAAEGDYIGLPFEHIEQAAEYNSGLSKFSTKYIREPLPDPQEDKDLYRKNETIGCEAKNAYKFGFMLLKYNDYNWKRVNNLQGVIDGSSFEINFMNTDNKTSDDTKFLMDGGATIIKNESQYQLTKDQKDYTFVSKSEDFKTLTDDYTNEIFTNIPIDQPQMNAEYGESMSNLINAVRSIVNDKSKNPTSTYADALKYVISNKQEFKKSDYWGQSFGNGSMFKSVITAIAAQDYEQGLELTELMVKNTHDNEESLTGAKAVYTTIFLACCGLRTETIRKIVHFMFFNPNPPKDFSGNAANLCNYDLLSQRKNINQNDPEAVRKCDREQLEKDIKAYKYSEQTSVTATLAIRTVLTAESTEEAKGWGLEAGGDCDTLLFFIMAMASHLHGSIKSDVEKMKRILLKTQYKKEAMQKQIEKEKDDPNAIKRIEQIDGDDKFVYYTNINNKFNEMFNHHTRAGSKIQRQLLNIRKFMEYLFNNRGKSKVENKEQLLNEIFENIRSDIDFMLDAKTKHKMDEIDPSEIENMKKKQKTIRSLSKEQTDKIMKDMEQNKNVHDQEIKKLKDEYNIKIRMHKNATARFQNKIKEDKRKNLTEQDIKDIGKEINEVNSFFQERGVNQIPIDNYNLKTKDSLNQIFIDENKNPITHINYGGNDSDKIENFNKPSDDFVDGQKNDLNSNTENRIKEDKQQNSAKKDFTYTNTGVDIINNLLTKQRINEIERPKIDGNNPTFNPYLKYFIGLIIWLIIIFVSFLLFCLEIISLAAAIIITVATLILDSVLMFVIFYYTKNPNDNSIKTEKFRENGILKETEKGIQNIKQDTIEDVKYIDD